MVIVVVMMILTQALEMKSLCFCLNVSLNLSSPPHFRLHLFTISSLDSSAVCSDILKLKTGLVVFPLFLSPRRAQAEEEPDPWSYTFKETRHVEIFTPLGKSSQTSLYQGLNFSIGISRAEGRVVGGVRVPLPPEVLLQIVRKKERDI